MAQAAGRALGVDADLAVHGLDDPDVGDAELGRFLDHGVHGLALQPPLGEVEPQGRLLCSAQLLGNLDGKRSGAGADKRCGMLRPGAVEASQSVTDLQAHDPRQVVGVFNL